MAEHRREYGQRGDCYAWPRQCSHHDDLDCMEAEESIGPSTKPLLRHRLSYWIRPYDAHMDRRRWRWTRSGCRQSRDWWAENGYRFILPVDSNGDAWPDADKRTTDRTDADGHV